jgi:hypothetical protein
MGGFMLYEDDKPPSILDPRGLEPYLQRGEIDITEKEIQDRSRGDVLSKGLVIVQTGWFVFQCIARSVEHLPITELELVTLAFATLNFVTYGLWWDKPLSVQCPYRVIRKGERILQSHAEGEGDDPGEEERQGEYQGTVLGRSKNIIRDIGKTMGTVAWAVPTIFIYRTTAAIRKLSMSNINSHSILAIFRGTVACVREKGIWGAIGHGAWLAYDNSLGKIGYMGRGNDDIATGAESVPMFYSGKLAYNMERHATLIASTIATLFGAIHCIAWSFEFGSHTEKWLWCLSSLAITSIPLIFFIGFRFDTHLEEGVRYLSFPFILLGGILYVLARILSLLLPFVSLRSLPPEAYQTVRWTTFIPHI